MRIRKLAMLSLCLVGAGIANASILTTEVEDAFGGVSVINGYTWTSTSGVTVDGVDKVFTLPKFDPTLGTLQSVTLRYTASSAFDLHWSGSTSTFKAKGVLGVEQVLYDANGNVLFDLTAGVQTPGYPSYYALGTGTFAAVGTQQGLPSPSTSVGTSVITTQLAAYTGTGTFNLTYNSSDTFTGSFQNGNWIQNGSASDGGAVSVVYAYTPIATPEPATMALMGSALLGLAALGKRFRR